MFFPNKGAFWLGSRWGHFSYLFVFLTNILLFFIWIGRSTAKLREEFDSGVPFGWFALFFCVFAELSTVDGVKTSKWSRMSE